MARLSAAAPPGAALIAFALLFGLGQFHRASGSVMVPEIVRDLAISAEAAGLMSAALFLAAALAQIPCGILLDRYGPRAVATATAAFAVAGSVLVAIADGLAPLLAGRALLGLGFSSIMTAAIVHYSAREPQARLATTTSRMFLIGGIGGLSATTPLAWIVAEFGWRSAMMGTAAITALLILALYAALAEQPGASPAPARREGLVAAVVGLGAVLAHAGLRRAVAMAFCAYAPMMLILGLWGGPYLRDVHGLDAVTRGNLLLVLVVASNVGVFLYGPLDRRFDTRKRVVLAGAGTVLAIYVVLAAWPSPPLWVVVALLGVLGLAVPFNVPLFAHARGFVPGPLAGRAVTITNLAALAGIAVMQGLSGLLVGAFPTGPDASAPEVAYRAVFLAMAATLAAAILVYRRADDVRPSTLG